MPYYSLGYTSTSGSGSSVSGGDNGLLIQEYAINLSVIETTSSSLSSSDFFIISASNTENPTFSELLKATLQFSESNNVFTETRDSFLRSWALTSSDNDSSRTTPTNANGQNNGTLATISTNLNLGDLTNPVFLSSTFNLPSGTFTSQKIRVFFSVPARTTALDTIKLSYKMPGSSSVAFYTHTGTVLVDYSGSGYLFDVSTLNSATLGNIVLSASYTATVVATPETSIKLDAWCLELEGVL